MLHTSRNVIAQDLFFSAPQSDTHSGNLGDHIDAIPVFFQHSRDPADLAFNSVETFEGGRLDVCSHSAYIPPMGIFRKGQDRMKTEDKHGCCGGTAKALPEQINSPPVESPAGKGCGCGSPSKSEALVAAPRSNGLNSPGTCCGGDSTDV